MRTRPGFSCQQKRVRTREEVRKRGGAKNRERMREGEGDICPSRPLSLSTAATIADKNTKTNRTSWLTLACLSLWGVGISLFGTGCMCILEREGKLQCQKDKDGYVKYAWRAVCEPKPSLIECMCVHAWRYLCMHTYVCVHAFMHVCVLNVCPECVSGMCVWSVCGRW